MTSNSKSRQIADGGKMNEYFCKIENGVKNKKERKTWAHMHMIELEATKLLLECPSVLQVPL